MHYLKCFFFYILDSARHSQHVRTLSTLLTLQLTICTVAQEFNGSRQFNSSPSSAYTSDILYNYSNTGIFNTSTISIHSDSNKQQQKTYINTNTSVVIDSNNESSNHDLEPVLLYNVYTTIFRLRDGSTLSSVDSSAIDVMKGSVRRILAAKESDGNLLTLTRSLPDDRLLGLLLLAVAGNFTVDQSPSALPQRCGIVVDPGTGVLMLRDNTVAQSVILEVLLIVSIVCLLRAWSSTSKENHKIASQ